MLHVWGKGGGRVGSKVREGMRRLEREEYQIDVETIDRGVLREKGGGEGGVFEEGIKDRVKRGGDENWMKGGAQMKQEQN